MCFQGFTCSKVMISKISIDPCLNRDKSPWMFILLFKDKYFYVSEKGICTRLALSSCNVIIRFNGLFLSCANHFIFITISTFFFQKKAFIFSILFRFNL